MSCACSSRRSAAATCISSSPACRSSPSATGRARISRPRRWRRRSAPAPTRSAASRPGRFIEFDRVPDYWAKDLPVNVGQNNFDRIRYEYFRDRTVAFEAFKNGTLNYHEEYTSRIWATGYDFPAMREGQREEGRDLERRAGHDPGLVLQHAPRRLQGSAHPRGHRPRLRLRMDEREHHVRRCIKRTTSYFENTRHEGVGQAFAGGAGAAGAVPRQAAGRRLRRAVRAAGLRRLGPGPAPPAPRGRTSARGRLQARGRRP